LMSSPSMSTAAISIPSTDVPDIIPMAITC
jgi:hypothetical protein